MGAARLAVRSIAAAVAAAQKANKVVIFAYDDGTEGSDRGVTTRTPASCFRAGRNALISAVAAVNPNVVVVLKHRRRRLHAVARERQVRCSRCGIPASPPAESPPQTCSSAT